MEKISKRMAYFMLVYIFVMAFAVDTVYALSYEDEPYFTVYVPNSNHLDRGSETQVVLMVQNDALLKELKFNDYENYAFLEGQSSILTTAYNVTISFEAPDGMKVLTPAQKYPALEAMKPFQLPVSIRVSQELKAGEYDLKVKFKYDIIDFIFLDSRIYSPTPSSVPKETQNVYEYTYNNTSSSYEPSGKKSTIVSENLSSSIWYSYIKYDYDSKEQVVTVKLVVEEEDVKLKIIDVDAKNMVVGGKGSLTLKIKNAGEKEGRNMFIVLSTPSGFSSLSSLQSTPSSEALQPILSLLMMQQGMAGGNSMDLTSAFSIPPELTAVLSKGTYYIGDFAPNQSIDATFIVDISAEEPGIYPFQIGGVYVNEFGETKQTSSVAFGVQLIEGVKFDLIDSVSSIYAGSKGDFIARILPTGSVSDLKASLEVRPPLTATISETFVGDVDDVFEAKFKIKAISDAEPGKYPAKIKLVYDINDKEKTEEIDVGIFVNSKMKFSVDGKGQIPAGEEKTVTALLTNKGNFEIKDATARITVVDPFSSVDDTAFIGDLKPGETVNATFKLKADSDATIKTYALNLEVKYKDISDEWVISDPEKMPIEVVESGGVSPMVILGLLVVVVGAAYFVYSRSKK